MPKGRVKWYDESDGRGVVERNGREYAVTDAEIDNEARVAGAPVHFDIDRADEGDLAVRVRMRGGSRTSHRTGRYGDQTGAHHPAEKGQDEQIDRSSHVKDRRAYGDQPVRLAEDWVGCLASGQIDRAVGLYAPDATIHEGGRTIAGGRDIRRHLQSSAVAGADDRRTDIEGVGDDRFRVRWAPMEGESAAVLTTLRVAHGRIVEQWIEEAS